MIELKHVQKYFNRHRANQIHVINDTSLEIADTGLVAILGASGSGKTTLLNAIGGLDKVSRGKIYVNGQKITRFRTGKIDEIRNLNIGYIFQNYHLLDDLTVRDNIALALKMIGIKSRSDIEERVSFVLNAVGMYRYRNRPAGMLSGGERQRVGIARALVKDPKIIIADEPTGNLDSKNSLEIMHILKSISKTRSVILVTHEEDLAHFFADRILELVDGRIVKDYANDNHDELDYRIDNKIYLKDLPSREYLAGEDVSLYFFGDNPEPVKILMAVKNGNIFIKTTGKVEVVDDSSPIELVNDHYQKISQSDVDEYKFELPAPKKAKRKPHYSSIYNPLTLITNGFRQLSSYGTLKKILLFGFVLASMFVLYSVSNIFGITKITDSKFVTTNKNYVRVTLAKVSVAEYQDLEAKAGQLGIQFLIPGDSQINLSMKNNIYYQTASGTSQLNGSLTDSRLVSAKDLIAGRTAENDYELVIDKLVIDANSQSNKMSGYIDYKDYLGQTIELTNLPPFTIVGISDVGSPSIFARSNSLINLIAASTSQYGPVAYAKDGSQTPEATVLDYTLMQDSVQLQAKSSWPTGDYDVIIPVSEKDSYKIGKQIDAAVNGTKLTVVGYYYSPRGLTTYLVSPNTVKYQVITNTANLSIATYDRAGLVTALQAAGYNAQDVYAATRQAYIDNNAAAIKSNLIVAGIILLISMIEIFLMIRSSFLSRVKEVGTLRAIGLKKSDIYKMFYGEIFAITLVTSVIGIGFMAYLLNKMLTVSYFRSSYCLSWPIIGLSFLIVFVFNSLVGLLPVYTTLRKTPAAILSRIDVD